MKIVSKIDMYGNMKIKDIFYTFIFFLCGIYVLTVYNDQRYGLLWILPILYGSGYLITKIILKKKCGEFGIKAIMLISMIRYVVMPVGIVASGYYSGFGPEPNSDSITKSILLMGYEFILVIVCIIWFKLRRQSANYVLNEKIQVNESKNSILFAFLVLSFILISAIDYRLLIPNNFFIIKDQVISTTLDFDGSGIVFIIRNTFRVIFPIVLLSIIYSRRRLSQKLKLILSLVVVLITVGLHTSIGRWDILFLSIVSMSILNELYPSFKKEINGNITILMGVSLLSITLYKFFGYTVFDIESFRTVFSDLLDLFSRSLQAYFSGPRNIALAIEMAEYLDVTMGWLYNDFFGSLPGFSQYFNQDIRFNTVYNSHIFGGHNISQIIPMVGIGFNVFGFILAPLITIGFILLVLMLDEFERKTSSLAFKYLTKYMIVYTAMCMGMNIQIITNKYYAVFLPALSLIWFSFKFTKGLKRNEKQRC